jgi:hypothetical protein
LMFNFIIIFHFRAYFYLSFIFYPFLTLSSLFLPDFWIASPLFLYFKSKLQNQSCLPSQKFSPFFFFILFLWFSEFFFFKMEYTFLWWSTSVLFFWFITNYLNQLSHCHTPPSYSQFPTGLIFHLLFHACTDFSPWKNWSNFWEMSSCILLFSILLYIYIYLLIMRERISFWHIVKNILFFKDLVSDYKKEQDGRKRKFWLKGRIGDFWSFGEVMYIAVGIEKGRKKDRIWRLWHGKWKSR